MRRQVRPPRVWRMVALLALLGGVVVGLPVGAVPGDPGGGGQRALTEVLRDARALDGRGNNRDDPARGAAGTPYQRVADPAYPDGRGAIMTGPAARYVSNRIFSDLGQNLFSENDASQWVWIWGQFVDHDVGFRDATPGEDAPIPFEADDPLERYRNDLGMIDFHRTPAAPGTGRDAARQQINQITSFIDGSQVYGVSPVRLDWLRAGPLDGDPTNNEAELLLPNGFLPRPGDRGERIAAPLMDLNGPLAARPELARVAGDTRANENMPLTLTQTLLAREHNRIVGLLPDSLPEEQKFQIARRVVGAEIQFVTYTEFLPALGVDLPGYTGYDPNVNPSLTNEFATVAYRAHSMVHGEFNPAFSDGDYTQEQLDEFRRRGIGMVAGSRPGEGFLEIPLSATFGNPDLLGQVGIARLAAEFAAGHQYRNDEQIDDALRSVLFQIPRPGARDPKQCGRPIVLPDCFSVVVDLGAIDIQRGRDHGIPPYNALRQAYGLAPKASFADLTGERTEGSELPIDDPQILDFVQLRDIGGAVIDPSDPAAVEEQAVAGVRRTTLASRLRAVYGSVDRVDAFVGMIGEPHRPGEELGELQRAIWRDQFVRLRDGDRYFYAADPALPLIERQFGITYRHSLADLIRLNTGARTPADAFRIPPKR
jgi:hypothetical protein